MSSANFDSFFSFLVDEGLVDAAPTSMFGNVVEPFISKRERVRTRFELIFDSVDFESATVLDIGAGAGEYSAYAAHCGADRVVALEPEAAGSSSRVYESLTETTDTYPTIEPVQSTFQDYTPAGETFDIVISHNSINHLNEKACSRLHTSQAARETYQNIFVKLGAMTAFGGMLVVSDAARRSFWTDVGVSNPFASSIEPRKHQPPTLWRDLLSSHHFTEPRIVWLSSVSALGPLGKTVFSNRLFSYLTNNLFVLTMSKV